MNACRHIDDPSLQPVSDPRYAEPPPKLREIGHDPLRNVFFGDLHVHTAYSYDAYTLGTRALPDDAYVYAKGGTIDHAVGYPIRAIRPLDFAAVTDHAEYLGVARDRDLADGQADASLRDVLETGSPFRITAHFMRVALTKMGSGDTRDKSFGGGSAEVATHAWQQIVEAAERHNQPGRFTAFIGYEWSSMPREDNLHRNVIYRSALVPKIPFSSLDSENPEDLWRALDNQRGKGMEMIAIPHNANVSNGMMYRDVTFDGSPLSSDYARRRMRNEPVSEIFQVKGSSETHPILSNTDEFAGFELYDQMLRAKGGLSEPKGSYARDAFETGLELSRRDGFNPYRFGVIGSSDSHNASSSVEEDNYHGKLPMIDGTVGIRLGLTLLLPRKQNRGARWSAAGLAAVWAEENTRESLFDAMRRKETYATSGPRMTVRFFGGWNFAVDLPNQEGWLASAYSDGVPMGGTLSGDRDRPSPGANAAPRFVVVAAKDPIGANLDRIQVVKGWVDQHGKARERIYDVIASDGRQRNPQTNRVSPLESTVNTKTATYSNSIGANQLSVVWQDPDFDAKAEAFYYARVLEIPTPRWSTYDATKMGIDAPEPSAIQERAVTSAIWYQPRPDTMP